MLGRPPRFLTLVALACFVLPLSAAAEGRADDLRARRAKLMERLGRDALFIAWSAPTRVYSLDVNYEYRQDSNLLYLTGIEQEGTILALLPGNRDATRREILFVSQPIPTREHWNGHLLTREEATFHRKRNKEKIFERRDQNEGSDDGHDERELQPSSKKCVSADQTPAVTDIDKKEDEHEPSIE